MGLISRGTALPDPFDINGPITSEGIGGALQTRERDDPNMTWYAYAQSALFRLGQGADEYFQFTRVIADGNTAMIIRRDLAGVETLQQVSQGAMDSGGAGFRLLRIPN